VGRLARLLRARVVITSDDTNNTSDNTVVTADGGTGGGITADSMAFTADALYPTADGYLPANLVSISETADALDEFTAKVVPAHRLGIILKPPLVVGYGYGVLPELIGEAHGEVYIAGSGAATVPIAAAAAGEVEQPFPSDDEMILMLLMAA
jgi:hypothetical protein